MGAVGSTFQGAGGLIIFVLYLVLGPGGFIFNLVKLIADKVKRTGNLSQRQYDATRKFLAINACVTALPFGIWALSLL
jgi:hypothetical protein